MKENNNSQAEDSIAEDSSKPNLHNQKIEKVGIPNSVTQNKDEDDCAGKYYLIV